MKVTFDFAMYAYPRASETYREVAVCSHPHIDPTPFLDDIEWGEVLGQVFDVALHGMFKVRGKLELDYYETDGPDGSDYGVDMVVTSCVTERPKSLTELREWVLEAMPFKFHRTPSGKVRVRQDYRDRVAKAIANFVGKKT